MSLAGKLPDAPIHRLTRPLERFLHVESAGGVVLLICMIAALALANSPAADAYHHFWHTRVSLEIGGFKVLPELSSMTVYLLMATILLWRPEGLFGRKL